MEFVRRQVDGLLSKVQTRFTKFVFTTPEGDSYFQATVSGELHGPFTIFEATEFARLHNESLSLTDDE